MIPMSLSSRIIPEGKSYTISKIFGNGNKSRDAVFLKKYSITLTIPRCVNNIESARLPPALTLLAKGRKIRIIHILVGKIR